MQLRWTRVYTFAWSTSTRSASAALYASIHTRKQHTHLILRPVCVTECVKMLQLRVDQSVGKKT